MHNENAKNLIMIKPGREGLKGESDWKHLKSDMCDDSFSQGWLEWKEMMWIWTARIYLYDYFADVICEDWSLKTIIEYIMRPPTLKSSWKS